MKLQQLRFLCEIADHGYNFAKAAQALHTSQPGISKQVKLLERELGIDLFARRQGRIVEVTQPGREVIALARSVLREAQRVQAAARGFLEGESGSLDVAATYMLARYALPAVYKRFAVRYPAVTLKLVQGSPERVSAMAACGEVDVAVTTRLANVQFDGILVDYAELPRVLVVPARHPLLHKPRITLQDMAAYPFVRLGRHRMRQVFRNAGLAPRVLFDDLEADIDVVKGFVEAGLGIAILPEIAYDARRDRALRAIALSHLFEPHTCSIALRRNHYLRGYAHEFIRMLAPGLSRDAYAQ